MKARFENIEQRLRIMKGALRLREVQEVASIISTDWPQENPRKDVLRLRRAQVV